MSAEGGRDGQDGHEGQAARTVRYAGMADVMAHEVAPALHGSGIDARTVTRALRDRGIIRYDSLDGLLVMDVDEDGATPGFWETVADVATSHPVTRPEPEPQPETGLPNVVVNGVVYDGEEGQ